MKKIILIATCLLMQTTGCVSWPANSKPPSGTGSMTHASSMPSGPITADMVESSNAHRVADAVWDEIDRDQQKDSLPENAKETKKR